MARRATKPAVTPSVPVEGLWELPDGWRWDTLAAVATDLISGRRPKGGIAGISEGCSSIGGEHLRWDGSISTENTRYIPFDFAAGLEFARVRADDILIVKDGATTGKTAFATLTPGPCYVNEHVFILRVDLQKILPKFAFYWLWSKAGFSQIMKDFRGAAQGGIGRTMPGVVAVPIPPVEKQQFILQRIDDLFAELDDADAALARAKENLGVWRKALLKAAVTGALTANWRAENPHTGTGVELLAQILAERRGRSEERPARRSKPRPEPPEATTDKFGALPNGWVWAPIGDLFDVFVGATPSRADKSLWKGDVPWVSSGEVSFCRIHDTREKISRAALRGSASRLHPPGTIMLGMIGEGKTRGQAAILDIEAAHNQNCASIRVNETPIPSEYVYLSLVEQYERTRLSSSGGNQPALNKERVKAIHLSLPGAIECNVIARIYDEAASAIDAYEEDRLTISSASATLRQSILAAAFRGDLVQ